ncbi:nucleotidyltransferase family protein [Tenacibaculum amylolyticum]|uniref:nucleotidyltransferase family protein n=1 Tax=Tenacibaculum amylolyticum TaxID=104269 RepID=UPI0038946B52
MTYKETLFFVGKCLTINHEAHNKEIVKELLESNTVDWDAVVKVSTSHYVFPALYCNLKQADFLKYLPEDLVAYMQHLTDLNRDRNKEIIAQAKELNELLLANNITPIFLKGTGNLLSGLYNDIAERMVGDIDLLFCNNSIANKAFDYLITDGYYKIYENHPRFHRHLSGLIKAKKISRIEIHKEMTTDKYATHFNYNTIVNNIFSKDNISFLAYKDQLSLSIIAKQINDDGQYFNDISLRNAYDVFLLAQKVDTKESISRLNSQLVKPLNNFLASASLVLNSKTITYVSNKTSKTYINTFRKLIENKSFRDNHRKKWKRRIFISIRLNIISKALYKREYTYWLLKRLLKGRI